LSPKARRTLIDRVMMIASVGYPLTAVPQAIKIYQTHSATGVALSSWLGFMCFGAIFLTYAVVHRIKPMIISQILWFTVDILIVAGTIMYQ
jgi:uncharacterized protein with PQ loop repeat